MACGVLASEGSGAFGRRFEVTLTLVGRDGKITLQGTGVPLLITPLLYLVKKGGKRRDGGVIEPSTIEGKVRHREFRVFQHTAHINDKHLKLLSFDQGANHPH